MSGGILNFTRVDFDLYSMYHCKMEQSAIKQKLTWLLWKKSVMAELFTTNWYGVAAQVPWFESAGLLFLGLHYAGNL